jgi:hypothetical protein
MRSAYPVAYFTQDTLDSLYTINDFPQLSSLNVPPGKYRTARTGRPNKAHLQGSHLSPSATGYLTSKASGPQTRYPSYGPENYTIHNDAGCKHSEYHKITCHGNRSKSYKADDLAPLAYLQNIPPPLRHPMDEKALMSFSTEILR